MESPIVAPEIGLGEDDEAQIAQDEMEKHSLEQEKFAVSQAASTVDKIKEQLDSEGIPNNVDPGAAQAANHTNTDDPLGASKDIADAQKAVSDAHQEQASAPTMKAVGEALQKVALVGLGVGGLAAITAIAGDSGIMDGMKTALSEVNIDEAAKALDNMQLNADGSLSDLASRDIENRIVPDVDRSHLLARAETPGMVDLAGTSQGLV